MIPLLSDFPALKVVFEHITTQEAADVRERRAGDHRRDDHRRIIW